MFSWKTFNEVEPQLMTSRYRILSWNPYDVNTTFTAIGLHCSRQNTNHTATLTSTLHLRSSNGSHIEAFYFIFFSLFVVFILHAFGKVTLTPAAPVLAMLAASPLLAAQLYISYTRLGAHAHCCVCSDVLWGVFSCQSGTHGAKNLVRSDWRLRLCGL